MNSAGVADQKFAIYQESVQAALDKATASWEGFWQASINSDAIIWVINAFSDLLDWLTQVGGVIPIVSGLIAGGLTYAIIQLIPLIGAAAAALKGLTLSAIEFNTLMGGLPIIIGLVVTAIASIAFAASNAKTEIEKSAEATKKLVDAYNQYQESAKKSQDAQLGELRVAEELTKTLFELSDKVNKTASDKERMAQIVNQLNDIMPDLNLHFNQEAAALDLTETAIYKNIEALKAYFITLAKGKEAAAAGETLNTAEPQRDDVKQKLNAKQKEVDALQAKIDARLAEGGGAGGITMADKLDDLRKLKEELANLQKQYNDLTVVIDDANAKIKDFADAQPAPRPSPTKPSDGGYTPPILQSDVNDEVSNQLSLINDLSAAYEKLSKGQSLSNDEISDLISKYPILASYLAKTGDETFKSGEIVKSAFDKQKGSFYTYLQGVINSSTATKELKEQAQALLNVFDQFTIEPKKELEDFDEVVNETSDSLSTLDSAYQTLADGQSLSLETILELIDKYPALADYIAATGDLSFAKGQKIAEAAALERKAFVATANSRIANAKKEIAANKALVQSYLAVLAAAIVARDVGQITSSADAISDAEAAIKKAEQEVAKLQAQINAITSGGSGSGGGGGSSSKISSYLKGILDKLDARAKKIDAAIDREKKELDLIKDRFEQEKKINDLLKAREELANAQNERNTRMLINGEWQWVADPRAVREAQERVDELERQKKEDDVIKAQQAIIDNLEKQKDIYTNLKEAINNLSDSAKKSIKSWDALIAALKKAGLLPSNLPKLDVGGEVKDSGAAVIHRGEGVLKADQNKNFKEFVNGLSNTSSPLNRLMNLVKLPTASSFIKNNNTSNSGGNVIIQNLTVQSNNAQSFVKDLQLLVPLANRVGK